MIRDPSRTAHPIVAAVHEFVAREVEPVASALEHADAYPDALVERMKALGLFGALIPVAYGGLGLEVSTYARVIEEICRGFMSLAGVINSHTMAALIVLHHGTDAQRTHWLPRFASGRARGGLCLTEPHAGSDVQAIRTVARREGDHYLISGSKMFVTNGREGNTFALLALTDPAASPRHRGMSCFIVEKGRPGLQVVKSIAKLGYKSVDTAELFFDSFACPAANLVGGIEGRGFKHVMSGLETGRINIAARAVGVAQAALEESLRAADSWPPPSPALGAIAARVEAARLVTYWAADMKDRGERCDLEAGMAKLYASEVAQEAASVAMQTLGPESQLTARPVERLYRDTPLMIIGEGTNEIQRLLIARSLLDRYGERAGPLLSREREREERRQLVFTIRQLVDKEVLPVVSEHDSTSRHPAAIVERLGELGIFGALVPAERGGLGLDPATHVMLVEELARGWLAVAGLVAAQVGAAWMLAHFGGNADARVVAAMTRGERRGCLALGDTLTVRARADGWVLSGRLPLVEAAAHADLFVVTARTDPGLGPAAFVLPRDSHRLALGAPADTLGGRGLGACDLVCDGVELAASARLGDDAASAAATVVRLGRAAMAVGVAQAAFEAALRYSQQRSAFGQPICQHQAIQLKLADMATRITAARLLTSGAAERFETREAAAAALMARTEAADTAAAVTLEAMRVHGGYGYTREFPVERFYRDASWLLVTPRDLADDRRELYYRWRVERDADLRPAP